MKGHSVGIKPTMNIDTSSQAINLQQDLKAAQLHEIIFADYQKKHKNWSDLPTAPYTTSFAEDLILKIHERSILYRVKRVSMNEFQVKFCGKDKKEDETEVILMKISGASHCLDFGEYTL